MTVYSCTLIGLCQTNRASGAKIRKLILSEMRNNIDGALIENDTLYSDGEEVVDFVSRFEANFNLISSLPLTLIESKFKKIMENAIKNNLGLKLILYAYELPKYPTLTIDLSPLGNKTI